MTDKYDEMAERLARQIANCGIHEWNDENEIALARDIAAKIRARAQEVVK